MQNVLRELLRPVCIVCKKDKEQLGTIFLCKKCEAVHYCGKKVNNVKVRLIRQYFNIRKASLLSLY
jgi:hypothetical protein